jgi:Sulfotransferase domain
MMAHVRGRAISAVRGVARLYELPTAGGRALPDFLIIGVERAGTTSLYRYLVSHPQIMPLTLRRKGSHYFDTNFGKGIRWYRSHFPSDPAVRARVRRVRGKRVITGEACPYYVFHPMVPERVHAALPDVRLILMLRDPITRAYSQHQHEVARGFETLAFEDAIAAEPERLAGEEERLRDDPLYYSYSHQHHSYLARGRYYEQIVRWQAHFPPDQLLVVDTSAFFSDPDRGFRDVIRFLGVEDRSLDGYPRLNARSYGAVPNHVRLALERHFAEPNRQLEAHLGRTFPWSGTASRVSE